MCLLKSFSIFFSLHLIHLRRGDVVCFFPPGMHHYLSCFKYSLLSWFFLFYLSFSILFCLFTYPFLSFSFTSTTVSCFVYMLHFDLSQFSEIFAVKTRLSSCNFVYVFIVFSYINIVPPPFFALFFSFPPTLKFSVCNMPVFGAIKLSFVVLAFVFSFSLFA